MDLDELLHEHGAAWRDAQPPPPAGCVELAQSDTRPRRPRRPRRGGHTPGHRARRAMAVVLLVAMVAGVGAVIASRRSPDSTTVAAEGSTTTTAIAISPAQQAALDTWASFPVDAPVRPLIMEGDTVDAPASGFTSNGGKDSFASGAFTDPPTIPAGPAESAGYPIIDARDALVRLRDSGDHQGNPAALTITDIHLGEAPFTTDRGQISLPAWIVRFRNVANPAAVLAVAPSAIFTPPAEALQRPPTFGSSIAADDKTISISVVGGPPGDGPCTSTFTTEVAESATAAVIEVHEVTPSPPSTNGALVACAAVGYTQTLTVTLSQPLGNRVLVDAKTRSATVVARR